MDPRLTCIRQLSFDWDPIPDYYFYSFLLLPSSPPIYAAFIMHSIYIQHLFPNL